MHERDEVKLGRDRARENDEDFLELVEGGTGEVGTGVLERLPSLSLLRKMERNGIRNGGDVVD
jgi:hypothetical protein